VEVKHSMPESGRLKELRHKSISLFNEIRTKLDNEGIFLLNEYESILTEIQILESRNLDDETDDK
jgi:predicted ATPase